ncbi:hypothetical protein IJG73_01720 [Candidatus Saccharibacteria bacterium]|nr:hypothetical protein [Candidatus Saccharibacteria bacterium]
MAQKRRKEKTIWRDERWRVALVDRTNNPGKKALAYFKGIKVASYDENGLHDHQDGAAVLRVPIYDEIADVLKVAWENHLVMQQETFAVA